MNKNKRRQVAKISVFITSVFVIFLSITYAFISMTLAGTKRQVITSGNLQLELEEGDAITIQNAMPMHDEVGMIQDSFDFKLKNLGNTDVKYSIKLIDITDSTKEKLNTNIVKYGLTKDGVVSKALLSSLNDNELDHGVISMGTKISYQLRLWIDSSVENNLSIQDKALSYRIDVVANQNLESEDVFGGNLKKIDVMYDERLEGYLCYDDFCSRGNQTQEIVFENHINIPENIDDSFDMSEEQNQSIIAYYEETGDTIYTLHVQSNGKIYANPDSSNLFSFFNNLKVIRGFEYFDTSKVINMSFMFTGYNGDQPLNLSYFNTSSVTNMSGMFSQYKSSQLLDLSGFDTSHVTDMSSMFADYRGSQPLDISHLDTSNVTDMSYMFYLSYGSSQPLDVSHLDTSKVTNMSNMFYGYNVDQPLDLSHFDTSNVTDMSSMLSRNGSSQLDVSSFNTSKVTNMSSMFSGCNNLTSLDLSNFDTSNVTDMSSMFNSCSNLIDLDLSSFDTSKLTRMYSMFIYCRKLSSLNLSSFDISNVTEMHSMFTETKKDCLITVRDEDTKAWILARRSDLTNVVVKSA